jgi:hypothetical protein
MVRNLPENLALVDAFVGSGCNRCGRPEMTQMTVEVMREVAHLIALAR